VVTIEVRLGGFTDTNNHAFQLHEVGSTEKQCAMAGAVVDPPIINGLPLGRELVTSIILLNAMASPRRRFTQMAVILLFISAKVNVVNIGVD